MFVKVIVNTTKYILYLIRLGKCIERILIMRLRNVKGSRETLAGSDFTVNEPQEYKGKWNEFFKNNNPIRIEIGMGKGQFITTLAFQNPEYNYIGIEKYSSVLVRAVEKQQELNLTNLVLIRMDAENICEVFDKGEVDRIYLNFSDPWPKDRHAKRRLTSRQFLARYEQILKDNGLVEFKTDNRNLFDFSVEEIEPAGWEADLITYDLHNSEYAEGNIMTEYETRFSSEGVPINKLVCHKNK